MPRWMDVVMGNYNAGDLSGTKGSGPRKDPSIYALDATATAHKGEYIEKK